MGRLWSSRGRLSVRCPWRVWWVRCGPAHQDRVFGAVLPTTIARLIPGMLIAIHFLLSFFGGDGLKHVETCWNQQPGRERQSDRLHKSLHCLGSSRWERRFAFFLARLTPAELTSHVVFRNRNSSASHVRMDGVHSSATSSESICSHCETVWCVASYPGLWSSETSDVLL